MRIEDVFEEYGDIWIIFSEGDVQIKLCFTKKEYKKIKDLLRDMEEKYDIKNDIGG